jgi:hypothetical protein
VPEQQCRFAAAPHRTAQPHDVWPVHGGLWLREESFRSIRDQGVHKREATAAREGGNLSLAAARQPESVSVRPQAHLMRCIRMVGREVTSFGADTARRAKIVSDRLTLPLDDEVTSVTIRRQLCRCASRVVTLARLRTDHTNLHHQRGKQPRRLLCVLRARNNDNNERSS